jgi:hypothetical protein
MVNSKPIKADYVHARQHPYRIEATANYFRWTDLTIVLFSNPIEYSGA